MTRPREGLRSGCGATLGIDVPPNQYMNEAIRHAVWNPDESSAELDPVEMASPGAGGHLRAALRAISHRLPRR